LAVAGNDGSLDIPQRKLAGSLQEVFPEGGSILGREAIKQDFGIGDDFLWRKSEQIPRPLADVGVEDLSVRRDNPLIDDAWN
jgi:hypothetical protein